MMPILPILCVCEKLVHKNVDVANFVAVPLETKYKVEKVSLGGSLGHERVPGRESTRAMPGSTKY